MLVFFSTFLLTTIIQQTILIKHLFSVSIFLSFLSGSVGLHHCRHYVVVVDLTDETLLELEKTLIDATAKFTSANPYNNSNKSNSSKVIASRDNRIFSSPLTDARAVMCNYDD